jgi:hypothetical protein
MGWSFKTRPTALKDEIQELTKGWEYTENGNTVKTSCIAHCWRGGKFKGNLWVVFEKVHSNNGVEVKRERFIALFLMKYNSGWGYKDITEDMGPCELSCPISYLEMVPDPGGYATAWREKVRALHNLKVELRRGLKIGAKVKMNDGISCNGVSIGGKEGVVIGVKPLLVNVDGIRVLAQTRHIAAIIGKSSLPRKGEIVKTTGFDNLNTQRENGGMTHIDAFQSIALIGLLGDRGEDPELLVAKPEEMATIESGGRRVEGSGEIHVKAPFEFYVKRDDYKDKTVYTFLLKEEW